MGLPGRRVFLVFGLKAHAWVSRGFRVNRGMSKGPVAQSLSWLEYGFITSQSSLRGGGGGRYSLTKPLRLLGLIAPGKLTLSFLFCVQIWRRRRTWKEHWLLGFRRSLQVYESPALGNAARPYHILGLSHSSECDPIVVGCYHELSA